jgi:hypothetical protein
MHLNPIPPQRPPGRRPRRWPWLAAATLAACLAAAAARPPPPAARRPQRPPATRRRLRATAAELRASGVRDQVLHACRV